MVMNFPRREVTAGMIAAATRAALAGKCAVLDSRAMRVGDYIDAYCSRCKRVMDHTIVSMEGNEVSRVRCRTCDYEHAYRPGQTGKKELTKEEAFNKVLASVMGTIPGAAAAQEKPTKSRRKKK